MKTFYGIIPPAVTPLTADNRLDLPGLERLLNHILQGGVHGIFILGTTGEGPALSHALQRQMIAESVRIVNGRVPVLAGITAAAAADAAELGLFAKAHGCMAAVAAPPCYFKSGDAELVDYYTYLTQAVKLPMFVYNMPGMTKVNISPSAMTQLAQITGICGCKDSSGDMVAFHDILQRLGGRDDFAIFTGPEELLGEAVLFGADGGVPGGANLNPKLFVDMYLAAKREDIPQVRALQAKIFVQRQLYSLGRYQSSMIKGLKSALRQKGICEDYLSLPFHHFEQDCASQIADILKTL